MQEWDLAVEEPSVVAPTTNMKLIVLMEAIDGNYDRWRKKTPDGQSIRRFLLLAGKICSRAYMSR
jgi:hypothetical protein